MREQAPPSIPSFRPGAFAPMAKFRNCHDFPNRLTGGRTRHKRDRGGGGRRGKKYKTKIKQSPSFLDLFIPRCAVPPISRAGGEGWKQINFQKGKSRQKREGGKYFPLFPPSGKMGKAGHRNARSNFYVFFSPPRRRRRRRRPRRTADGAERSQT